MYPRGQALSSRRLETNFMALALASGTVALALAVDSKVQALALALALKAALTIFWHHLQTQERQ